MCTTGLHTHDKEVRCTINGNVCGMGYTGMRVKKCEWDTREYVKRVVSASETKESGSFTLTPATTTTTTWCTSAPTMTHSLFLSLLYFSIPFPICIPNFAAVSPSFFNPFILLFLPFLRSSGLFFFPFRSCFFSNSY